MLATLPKNKIELVYPELSYIILGALFHVSNKVSPGHKEVFYQKAVAEEFTHAKLSFREQLPAKIKYRAKLLGTYFFDFLVEGKIIVKIKVRNFFSTQDITQIHKYLKAKNLKLGILAHFTKTGVKFKRIVNINP